MLAALKKIQPKKTQKNFLLLSPLAAKSAQDFLLKLTTDNVEVSNEEMRANTKYIKEIYSIIKDDPVYVSAVLDSDQSKLSKFFKLDESYITKLTNHREEVNSPA